MPFCSEQTNTVQQVVTKIIVQYLVISTTDSKWDMYHHSFQSHFSVSDSASRISEDIIQRHMSSSISILTTRIQNWKPVVCLTWLLMKAWTHIYYSLESFTQVTSFFTAKKVTKNAVPIGLA